MVFKQKKKIAVIGDVMVDEYIFGSVNRVNPEAPVPILNFIKKEYRLGGAANVANNIFSLGGHCVLIGRIGKDKKIKKILDDKTIHYDFLEDDSLPTITKTRFMAGNQQLLRLDEEEKPPISKENVRSIMRKLRNIDIIIVSDYAKGMVTKELMDELRKLNKIILADPKVADAGIFSGVFLLKPNIEEIKTRFNMDSDREEDVNEAGHKMQKMFGSNILITRGKDGMSLFEKDHNPLHIPANARDVYDVCGAGDTVIATIGVALASGKTLEESVILANKAAGIVIGKVGTATVTSDELFGRIDKESMKLKDISQIKDIVKEMRSLGKKIVFTNGCFDILHIGHTRLLNFAKQQGDVLILGLNTDASVKRIKGPKRPVVGEKERAEILSELKSVNYIVFFDEDTPEKIISEIRPDVIVKGGDYNPKDYRKMPESKIVQGYGGSVKIFSSVEGKATTSIIEKIKNEK